MPTSAGMTVHVVYLHVQTDKQYSEMILDGFSTEKKALEFIDRYKAENPGASLSRGAIVVK